VSYTDNKNAKIMSYYNSSAARTNLSSQNIHICGRKIAEGQFREVLEGTYAGGTRNQQAAVCKRFKWEYRHQSEEYFDCDFDIIDKVIACAELWNETFGGDFQIIINRGDIHYSNSNIAYLVEPFIRDFTNNTSNSGWIDETDDWEVRTMEAFSHFTYYCSNQNYLVCDLQGRYRYDRSGRKSRFELTDPAICSTYKQYGPTDLGWEGIESFFANHVCNEYCETHWSRPYGRRHFRRTRGTTFVF
jgi:hypothetical protein